MASVVCTEIGKQKAIQQLSEQFGIEKINKVFGDGIKRLAPAEVQNYGRTNRSLHYMADFSAGTIIQPQHIGVLRTEKILTPGITPDFLPTMIGKKLKKDVQNGAGVLLQDFLE